jgi:DNA polymerase III sliding clamp (beta) subunit (PCNA family)
MTAPPIEASDQATTHWLDELAARARGIVESKPSNPVLGCVIIDATPDGVTATSYRSSMGYVGTYTANVSDRGRIAVDVDALQKAGEAIWAAEDAAATGKAPMRR